MATLSPRKQKLTRDHLRRCLLWCALPAALFYALSLAISLASGFTILETLRDPAHMADHSPFLGFLSAIGVWLWLSAAAIALFRAWTYRPTPADPHRRLLLLVGYFSLVLAIDDYFMIHDDYIPEGILIPLYGLFVLYLWAKQRGQILAIDGTAFLLAGGFLAMSILVDAVQYILPMAYQHSQIFEEGFKFLGAATWAYFSARLAAHRLANLPLATDGATG